MRASKSLFGVLGRLQQLTDVCLEQDSHLFENAHLSLVASNRYVPLNALSPPALVLQAARALESHGTSVVCHVLAFRAVGTIPATQHEY